MTACQVGRVMWAGVVVLGLAPGRSLSWSGRRKEQEFRWRERPKVRGQRTNTVKYQKGKRKPASCGGCQVRSKALDSGSSLAGVRGFESHPPHYGYRF